MSELYFRFYHMNANISSFACAGENQEQRKILFIGILPAENGGGGSQPHQPLRPDVLRRAAVLRRDLASRGKSRRRPRNQLHGYSERGAELLWPGDHASHDLCRPKSRARNKPPAKGQTGWHQEHTSSTGRYMLERE